MIVVADTSPLNYLVLIDEIELLPALFGRVLIPDAVALELRHPKAPAQVRTWIATSPAWLEICTVTPSGTLQIERLDPGEREAIELAIQLDIDLIFIDEINARTQAKRLHLKVKGTLGILQQAATLGKIDLADALKKLEETNFRLSSSLRNSALEHKVRTP